MLLKFRFLGSWRETRGALLICQHLKHPSGIIILAASPAMTHPGEPPAFLVLESHQSLQCFDTGKHRISPCWHR